MGNTDNIYSSAVIYSLIQKNPNQLCSFYAKKSGYSKATISREINRLHKKGLVKIVCLEKGIGKPKLVSVTKKSFDCPCCGRTIK